MKIIHSKNELVEVKVLDTAVPLGVALMVKIRVPVLDQNSVLKVDRHLSLSCFQNVVLSIGTCASLIVTAMLRYLSWYKGTRGRMRRLILTGYNIG